MTENLNSDQNNLPRDIQQLYKKSFDRYKWKNIYSLIPEFTHFDASEFPAEIPERVIHDPEQYFSAEEKDEDYTLSLDNVTGRSARRRRHTEKVRLPHSTPPPLNYDDHDEISPENSSPPLHYSPEASFSFPKTPTPDQLSEHTPSPIQPRATHAGKSTRAQRRRAHIIETPETPLQKLEYHDCHSPVPVNSALELQFSTSPITHESPPYPFEKMTPNSSQASLQIDSKLAPVDELSAELPDSFFPDSFQKSTTSPAQPQIMPPEIPQSSFNCDENPKNTSSPSPLLPHIPSHKLKTPGSQFFYHSETDEDESDLDRYHSSDSFINDDDIQSEDGWSSDGKEPMNSGSDRETQNMMSDFGKKLKLWNSDDSFYDSQESDGSLHNLPRKTVSKAPISTKKRLHRIVDDSDSNNEDLIDIRQPDVVPSFAKPSATPARSRNFCKKNPDLPMKLFKEFNDLIFHLPCDVQISWSPRLKTTAGMTRCRRVYDSENNNLEYMATIELNPKVLDCEERLRKTLCHELCHAAAWIIDHEIRPPHGDVFKKWARKAGQACPGMEVTTCHNYEIEYKYNYKCTNEQCGETIGRQSKSINLQKQRCGRCYSKLELQTRLRKDGTPMKPRAANPYSVFVKENFVRIKKENPGVTMMSDIMKIIADEWKKRKNATM